MPKRKKHLKIPVLCLYYIKEKYTFDQVWTSQPPHIRSSPTALFLNNTDGVNVGFLLEKNTDV